MSERLEERLRRAAQTYRSLGNHSAEGLVLEAADTITELRGALLVASVDYRHLSDENAKLRTLCRDMYLVVEILDMDGMRLQAHGKDADWRTLKERFEELMGIEVDE